MPKVMCDDCGDTHNLTADYLKRLIREFQSGERHFVTSEGIVTGCLLYSAQHLNNALIGVSSNEAKQRASSVANRSDNGGTDGNQNVARRRIG